MFHDEFFRKTMGAIMVTSLSAALALPAGADEHRLAPPASTASAAYKAECGSCHLAFPPRLLSAPGWERVLAGLDRHFGTDASVAPAAAAELAAYLRANAGSTRRLGASATRISETTWFRNEHDEVPAEAWKSKQVMSVANCIACHTQAESGDFSERNLNLPWERTDE